jgi:hypothetical protein
MSKKKACPVCGAMNPVTHYKCRLCGRVLDVPKPEGLEIKTPPRERIYDKPKYSVNILIVFGAVVVALLVGAGMYAGFIKNEFIDRAAAIVQNQRDSDVRGWTEVSPDGADLTGSLPGTGENIIATENSLPNLYKNGKLLEGRFDEFDTAYIGWGELAIPVSESSYVTLERAVNAYAKDRDATIESFSVNSFKGRPAAFFVLTYRGLTPSKTKGFIVTEGDSAWLGATDSKTEKYPLYDTLSDQFNVTKP